MLINIIYYFFVEIIILSLPQTGNGRTEITFIPKKQINTLFILEHFLIQFFIPYYPYNDITDMTYHYVRIKLHVLVSSLIFD